MITTNKGKALTAILLALACCCTVLLAACDMGWDGAGILESIPDLTSSEAQSRVEESADESTPEGYTEKPTVVNIINISPSEVIIAGNCEQGATVFVKGGKEDVSVASTNGYYITSTTLINTTTTLLEITAKTEDKELSLPLSTTAYYSAIAESRLDGMSVTVGKNSGLYFEKTVADFVGSNLLTQTQLREFKAFVNSKVSGLEARADGGKVELIYVLIPNSTAVNSEFLADDIEQKTNETRYQQVVKALEATNATVVDLYDAFIAAKEEGKYPIYRAVDSHLTEYGSYVAYAELMKVIGARFPDAAAHSLDEFDISSKDTIGGDLALNLGIDKSIITESVPVLTPKFDVSIGDSEGKGFETSKINSIKTYLSSADMSIDTSKAAGTIMSRLYFRTGRTNMPSALVYRDDSAAGITPLLAERLNNSMFALGSDFTINLTDAGRHNTEGKALVDYVIVFVNESNIESILD